MRRHLLQILTFIQFPNHDVKQKTHDIKTTQKFYASTTSLYEKNRLFYSKNNKRNEKSISMLSHKHVMRLINVKAHKMPVSSENEIIDTIIENYSRCGS